MIRRLLILAPAALLAGTLAASAACYADYKAKRDNPLQLHYGVIQISDGACGNAGRAADEIRGRIGAAGWQLLNVVSTFGSDGLNQRKESAGQYFLRF